MFEILGIKSMKAMKQLLIVIGLVSMLSLNAQNFVEQPYAQMRSTSAMKGISSSLPQSAVSGTYTTYDSNSPYGPRTSSQGPKKAAAEDEEDTPPADPPGPNQTPIGDAVLPLLLLAAGYVFFIARKRRASSLKQ
jgi:hypothetical protein